MSWKFNKKGEIEKLSEFEKSWFFWKFILMLIFYVPPTYIYATYIKKENYNDWLDKRWKD